MVLSTTQKMITASAVQRHLRHEICIGSSHKLTNELSQTHHIIRTGRARQSGRGDETFQEQQDSAVPKSARSHQTQL
jgi:hypothetical protein